MQNRHFLTTLATLTLLICCAHSATAALMRYEPFDYSDVGGPVLGKSNPDGETWVGAFGPAPPATPVAPGLIKVASGTLAVPPQNAPSVGNSAEIDGGPSSVGTNPQQSGKAIRLPLGQTFTQAGGGTVYYSMALRIDELTGSNNTNGGFFMSLSPDAGVTTANPTNGAAKIQARIDPTDGTKYNLGIVNNRNMTGASSSWSPMQLDVGTTYFVVASYELIPGTSNDVSRMWINPDLTGPQPLPSAIDLTFAATDLNVASIILRQSPAPHLTLDELRVGTEWRDVAIPEPAALQLLLVGCAFLVGRRKMASRM